MPDPTASVIVCVYNRGRMALRCLDSLLTLRRTDFEIVLVDDGSTDDTHALLASLAARHPARAIAIEKHAHNRGLSAARNTGIRAARGAFVLFTDSDCVVDPGWLDAMLAGFTGPGIAAVGGRVENPPPRNWAERAYVGGSRLHRTGWQGRSLVGCNMAFRRAVVLKHPFDEEMTYYCDEDELTGRLRAAGHAFGYAPDAVVLHDHAQTLRSYLRQGYRQGQGAALLNWKRGRYIGRDMLPFFAAVATMPLGLIDRRLFVVPDGLLLLQVFAIAYNEHVLKKKSIGETIFVLPVCVLFYICKIAGTVRTLACRMARAAVGAT